MEAEDDMIVLVVVDDDEPAKISEKDFSPSEACMEVNKIIETAQKHGQYIDMNLKPLDEKEYQCDLEDHITSETGSNVQNDLKVEPIDNDNYYILNEDDELNSSQDPSMHRFAMLAPAKQRSFIEELKQKYEELREDEELLINTLEKIMRTVKAPPPPRDFYIMNGIMFECVYCGFKLDTIPAAGRHYQEKHGERYLVCYACGVDFRSTTNLYKHEKRCIAPDADVVLRARAAFLGCKGRSRPYLSRKKSTESNKFPCQLCSAVFITKNNLESHENLHRGERPFRCHACPCAYTSYSALSRHTKKHSDVQFICDHCNRSFKIKAALVAHMDTHKPIRKHGCEECDRRFAQKSALQLHVNKVHRNLPPPCACQICPKRYPRMSLLKAHMKRAHGMSIITRKMFFKSLPTMKELEVKHSKVVLKYNEDDNILDFVPPIKPEPITEDNELDFLKDYAEVSNEQEVEAKPEDMTMDDFMQYVTQGGQELGSNVVYIQNGEVVQIADEGHSQAELFLELEALQDGQIVVKPVTDRTLRSPGNLATNSVS